MPARSYSMRASAWLVIGLLLNRLSHVLGQVLSFQEVFKGHGSASFRLWFARTPTLAELRGDSWERS